MLGGRSTHSAHVHPFHAFASFLFFFSFLSFGHRWNDGNSNSNTRRASGHTFDAGVSMSTLCISALILYRGLRVPFSPSVRFTILFSHLAESRFITWVFDGVELLLTPKCDWIFQMNSYFSSVNTKMYRRMGEITWLENWNVSTRRSWAKIFRGFPSANALIAKLWT